jgi:hypothetical protein
VATPQDGPDTLRQGAPVLIVVPRFARPEASLHSRRSCSAVEGATSRAQPQASSTASRVKGPSPVSHPGTWKRSSVWPVTKVYCGGASATITVKAPPCLDSLTPVEKHLHPKYHQRSCVSEGRRVADTALQGKQDSLTGSRVRAKHPEAGHVVKALFVTLHLSFHHLPFLLCPAPRLCRATTTGPLNTGLLPRAEAPLL